ncbi:MAG: hypothetical protein ACRDCY_18175 [Aeromonas veronii]
MSILYSLFDQTFLDAMAQPSVTMAIAVKVEFTTGTTRAHSGTGTIAIDGEEYLGLGTLGEIGKASEEHTLSPTQLNMALNGLDTSLVATTLNERCVNRPVTLMAVVFNQQDGTVLGANVIFRGKIAKSAMTAGEVNALSFTVSNIFEDWQYGDGARFTEESHEAQNPGDHIFKHVSKMAERALYWGSEKDAPPFASYQ